MPIKTTNQRAIEPLDKSAKHDSSNEEDGAGNAIRSGEPEMESSFQHYFDLSGVFRFTSDSGRPGRTCVVNVGKNGRFFKSLGTHLFDSASHFVGRKH